MPVVFFGAGTGPENVSSINMNMNTKRHLILAASSALLNPAIALVDPLLAGNAEFEIWTGLTAANNPGYPDFFTFSNPWPSPISPTGVGSAGNAGFDKVAGGGYPAGSSIYNFVTPGTYSVTNDSPLPDLETVTFQLDLGEGDSFFLADPVLNYNGGTQALGATFSKQGVGGIAFTNPQTGDADTTRLFGFQWDLTSISGGISEYQIVWTTDAHTTTYELRLDSGDSFEGNSITAIPEASAGIGVLGLMGWAGLRRRRS